MANSIVIDISIKHDIEKAIKMLQDEIGSFEGIGKRLNLSKPLQAELERLRKELEDLKKESSDMFANLSIGKVDTSEFEKFRKNIEKRLNGISQNFDKVGQELKKVTEQVNSLDGSSVAKTVNEWEKKFENLTAQIKNSYKALSDLFKLSDKQGITKIFTTDDSSITALEKQLKRYKDMQAQIEASYNTKNMPKNVSNDTKKVASEIQKNIQQLKELSDSYNYMVKNINNPKVGVDPNELDDTQEKIVSLNSELHKLINLYNTLDPKVDAESLFPDVYEIEAVVDNIEQRVETSIVSLNNKIANYSKSVSANINQTVNTDTFQLKNGKIEIPIVLDDTSSQKLLSTAMDAVTYVQNRLKDSPLTVSVKLVSGYKTKEREEILSQMQDQIGNINDEEIRTKLESLRKNIADKFLRDISINVHTNVGETEGKVKRALSAIAAEVKKQNFNVSPTFNVSDAEKEKLKQQLSDLSNTLTFNLTDEAKKISAALLRILNTKNIDTWSEHFKSKLNEISSQLDSISNKFANSSIASNSDVDEFEKIIQALHDIQESLISINSTMISVYELDDVEKHFDAIAETISELRVAIQSLDFSQVTVNVSQMSNIDSMFEAMRERTEKLANETKNLNLTYNATKQGLNELIVEYQRYLDLGGTKAFGELGTNKQSDKLTNYYNANKDKVIDDSLQNNNLSKIVGDFDSATKKIVDNKTVLLSTIDEEITKISDLILHLDKIIKSIDRLNTSTNKLNSDGIKATIEALKSLPEISNIPNFETLKSLVRIKSITPEMGEKFKQACSGIADGIKLLKDNVVNQDISSSNVISQINDILKKSSELRDLATIINKAYKSLQSGKVGLNITNDSNYSDNINSIDKKLQNSSYDKVIQKFEKDFSQFEALPDGVRSSIDLLKRSIVEMSDTTLSAIKRIKAENIFDETREKLDLLLNDLKSNNPFKELSPKNTGYQFTEYITVYNSLVETAKKYNDIQKNIASAKPGDPNIRKWKQESEDLDKSIIKLKADLDKTLVGEFGENIGKMFTTLNSDITKAFTNFKSAGMDKTFSVVFDEARKKYEELQRAIDKGINFEAFKSKAYDILNMLNSTSRYMSDGTLFNNGQRFNTAADALKQFREEASKVGTITKDFNNETDNSSGAVTKWSTVVREADGTLKRMTATYNNVTNQMSINTKTIGSELTGLSGAIDLLKKKYRELVVYWTSNLLTPQSFIRYLKGGIQIIQQYDDALTEMRKVSDESLDTLREFQKESFNLASAVGTTGLQIQKSAADWKRLGESLQDSKQLAQDTAVLFNVSEFTDINEATESLVAMRQAYRELGTMDIIDKLNNVGNNFSISTSGLASALQRSASSLKTAGNDINEAIALITAGNQVVQDPESVGAAMRVLSLRLTGTKVAVQQLQDLGEETENVATTVAKLRDTIMSATKVASNGFAGFDILTENGNYKSTYEILLGIAEIYDEIIETDQKYGSNNINLLLETIAGKNRANIASSILSSVDTLKSVYETVQKSQGSAAHELDAYLDSISAKLQNLTNEVHEFWTGLIDSDVVKFFVELGTNIIKVINSTGQLQTVLVGLAAVITSKRLGMFSSVFVNGNKQIQLFGKNIKEIIPSIKNFFANIINGINNNDFSKRNQSLITSIFGLSDSTKVKLMDDYNAVADLANEQHKSFASVAKDLGVTDKYLLKYINSTEDAQKSSSGFSEMLGKIGAKSKLGNIALGALTGGLNILATVALNAAFNYFVGWLDNVMHRAERTAERVKELSSEFNAQRETLKKHKKTVDEISDEYIKLSQGVDKLGRNQSLTSEEFVRYHELTEQIAEMFPDLISGYDSQGHAIINLKDNVNALTEAYEKEREAANAALIAGSKDVQENAEDNIIKSTNGLSDYGINSDQYFDYLDSLIEAYSKGAEEYQKRWNEIEQELSTIGVPTDVLFQAFQPYDLFHEYDYTKEMLQYMDDQFSSINDVFIQAYQDRIASNSNLNVLKDLAGAYYESIIYTASKSEMDASGIGLISDSQVFKDFGSIIVGNISENILLGLDEDQSIGTYVKDILDKIASVMMDNEAAESTKTILDELFTNTIFNSDGSISDSYTASAAQEYIKTRLDIIKNVFQLTDEEIAGLYESSGFNKAQEAYEAWMTQWNWISQILPEFIEDDQAYDKVEAFLKENGINTASEITEFFANIRKALEEGATSWQEATDKWIEERDANLKGDDSKSPFSSLFSADSDAKDTISAFKTNIKQLGEAIANFQSLSPEEKTNIFETYAVGLEQMGFSGELTVDALQALANQQWETVDSLFDGVEGADEYRKALKALMDQAMNTGAGFKGSLESIGKQTAPTAIPSETTMGMDAYIIAMDAYNKQVAEYEKDQKKLTDYTRFFTDAQKTAWVTATSGAETADEAIQKWEQHLANVPLDNLTDILNDEEFQSVKSAAEELGEIIADGIQGDETHTLLEKWGLTEAELNNGAAQELLKWLNSIVEMYALKGGEAGQEWFNGWVSEQKKGTFSQIINAMADESGRDRVNEYKKINDQAKLLSNTERELFVKNYKEGDTFEKVLQKIEADYKALDNLDFPDLLNNELFSSTREEAEELSAILENGVTSEEGTTLLEKWGFTDETQAQAELERLTQLVMDAAKSAGAQGAMWGSNWFKGIFDSKRQLSLSDLFDFEFSYEKDGKQITQTLDAYTSEIVSKAQTIGNTIAAVTSKATDSNHQTWADIFGDADTLRELEAVIPGITTEIGKATQNESYSATVTNILVDAMSKLYDEYSTNTSTIRENKNLTEEASDALDRQNQIVKEATSYNIALKNGLRDVADNLDSIYFDGAYDSARSFGQAIEDVKGELDTLNNAYTQLIDGSLRENSVEFKNLVVDLTNQFPQLVGHTDSVYELAAAVAELMGTKSDSFIVMLDELRNREGIPDELRAKIDNVRESFQKLGSQPFSMDNAISVIKNARQELNQLADFMHQVNETGLHLDIDATDDVYNLYPELLRNAKIYRDGTIELNKDVYEAFIAAKQAEVQGDIDARIKELQARNEVYRRMMELEQKKVQIANEAMKATSLIAMQGAMNEIAAIDEELKAEAEKNLDVAQMDADTTQQKIDNSDLETKNDVENLQTQGDAFAEEATQESKVDEQNVQDQIDRDDDEKGNFITNMLDKVKAWFTGATEISDADADLNEQEQTNSAKTSETQQENDIAAGKTALGVMGEVSNADKETSETMAGNSEQLKTDITSDGDETGSAIVDGINQTDSTFAGAAYNAESNMAQSAEAIKGTINNLINLSHQFADAYAAAAQGKRAGNTTGVVGVLGGMLGGLKQGFSSIKKGLGGVFDSFMSPFKSTASSIGSWFSGSGSGSYGSVKKDLWTTMTDGIKKGVDNLTGAFTTASEKAAEVIEGIGDGAKTIVTKAQEFGIKLTTGIKDGDALKAVTTAIMKAGNWIAEHSGAGKMVSEEIANRYAELVANLKNIEKNSQDKIAAYADEIAKNEELIDWLKANGGLEVKDIYGNKYGNDGNDNGGNDGGSSGRDSNPDGGSSGRDGDNGQEDKEEEQYSEMIDWIEVRIQRLERVINKLDKVAGNSFENFQTRNKAIGMEIEAVKEEFDDTAKAFQRYMAEADAVPLDEAYKQKVQRGLIDIETITDENLKKNIEEYQTWLIIATLHGDMYVKFYLIAGKPLEVYYHNIMMRNA